MNTLITNCRIISPDLEIENGAIEISSNKIINVYNNCKNLPKCENTFDAKRKTVMPGFIDIHCHGALGSDVVDGTVEAIENIAKAKLKEGVTTFCPTTLTVAEETLINAAHAVENYKKTSKYSKVYGVHLEGPFLNPKCLGAQNPDFLRAPNIEEVKNLNNITKIAKVSLAVEVEGGIDFVRSLKPLGIVSSCGHSDANYSDFAKAKEAGLTHLTHFCNQMKPLHHREIGLVGAGLYDQDVLIEIICDTIHLCPDMLNLIFKLKNINKIMMITDSISASWLPDGDYKLGGLDVKVHDNIARLSSNGALAGSALKYFIGVKNIANLINMPLKEIVKTTSLNQALSFGIKNLGKIEKGYIADLVVLDTKYVPETAFVDGKKHDLTSIK